MEIQAAEGFIVHAYRDARRNQIHLLGRLADGHSFAARLPVQEPLVCVPAAESESVSRLLQSNRLSIHCEKTTFVTFEGAACERLVAENRKVLNRAVGILRKNHMNVYGADTKDAAAYLIRTGIRSGIRISGAYRTGKNVDMVFPDPEIVPDHKARAPLSILSLDIETEEPSGVIRAVGLSMTSEILSERKKALLFSGLWPDFGSPGSVIPDPEILLCQDERSLLITLVRKIQEMDPDIITGWNIIDFDFPRLAAAFSRCGIPFALGRSVEAGQFFPAEKELLDDEISIKRSASVFLPGRQVLDALRLIRSGFHHSFESYTLDAVAHDVLGKGKTVQSTDTEKLAELDRLYRDAPLEFCRYCLNDADLVLDILSKQKTIEHTIARAALTGAGIDKAWTSVASFEHIYAEGLYSKGILEPESDPHRRVSGAAGGTVLDPIAGIFHCVAVFDFRSLYPSIIRTFNIDPLAYERGMVRLRTDSHVEELIHAPNGAAFDRSPGFLPELIGEYFEERLAAIDRGDDASAFVYKILMNSFYGVLGTPKCKYAHTELAGAITSFGKLCLHFARDFCTEKGYRVLYGDTDSVFVELKAEDDFVPLCETIATELNQALAAYIRKNYLLDSFIGIRFEKLYHRFFIPRLRSPGDRQPGETIPYSRAGLSSTTRLQDDRGRAKGYAGLIIGQDGSTEIEIKGMEAARSDYTPLARRFQTELLGHLFRNDDTAVAETYIKDETMRLYRGELDDELVFRKRLRRVPESYTASTPPHIKVARALGWKHRRGTVEYLMTVNGPEAVSQLHSPIDYLWYATSQILPTAKSAGLAAGFDAEAIIKSIHPDGQLEFEWPPVHAKETD